MWHGFTRPRLNEVGLAPQTSAIGPAFNTSLPRLRIRQLYTSRVAFVWVRQAGNNRSTIPVWRAQIHSHHSRFRKGTKSGWTSVGFVRGDVGCDRSRGRLQIRGRAMDEGTTHWARACINRCCLDGEEVSESVGAAGWSGSEVDSCFAGYECMSVKATKHKVNIRLVSNAEVNSIVNLYS